MERHLPQRANIPAVTANALAANNEGRVSIAAAFLDFYNGVFGPGQPEEGDDPAVMYNEVGHARLVTRCKVDKRKSKKTTAQYVVVGDQPENLVGFGVYGPHITTERVRIPPGPPATKRSKRGSGRAGKRKKA